MRILLPILAVACSPDPTAKPTDPRDATEDGSETLDDTARPTDPGPVSLEVEAHATALLIGAAHSEAGTTLLRADVGGDGRDDLLVGGTWGVYLVYGPLSGTRELLAHDGYVQTAGGALAVGDFDADGSADLAAHASGSTRAIDIWSGPISGTRDLLSATSGIDAFSGMSLDPVPHGADLDGDTHVDLLLGLPSIAESELGRTGVRIYLGPITGTVPSANHDVSLVDERLTETAGSTIDASHDLDGDGRADVLIGAPTVGTGPGGAWILQELPLVDTSLEDLLRIDGGASLVVGVVAAGDLDDDGHIDMVADSIHEAFVLRGPFAEGRTVDDAATTIVKDAGEGVLDAGDRRILVGIEAIDGRVEVYEAPTTGFHDTPDVTFLGPSIGTDATFGDVTADGQPDVIIGGRYVDVNAGRVYVMDGHLR